MNYRERMKEYLKEPDEQSYQYGKWAILNREQRDLIKRLLREMDSADVVIKNQFEENKKLKQLCNKYEEEHNTTFEEWKKTINIIKEVREYIMSDLITEWDIENDGYVSGSDLPADAITPILEILDKENK